MTPVRLSVSMIVKDEEQFLPGCLESVREIADEIVVVDTGSTDRTVALALQAGAVVYHAPWTGSFAEARNTALDHCSGQWVLYLDADERLRAGQHELLRRLLADPRPAAYMLQVQSTLSTEAGRAVQVMPYPRLFRRQPGARFEGDVHEQIAPAILRKGGRILSSPLTIDHLGYDQGPEILRQKVRRNLALLETRLERNARDCDAHLHIAQSVLLLQDYPAVLRHARAALEPPGLPPPLTAVLYNLLAEVMLRTGRWADAAAYSRKSLALIPRQTGARWFLAGALVKSGNVPEAVPVLEDLAIPRHEESRPESRIGDDIVLPPQAVWDLLGRCYAELGLNEKAAKTLFEAVCADPSAAGTTAKFWEIHEKLGQPSLAIRHCEALIPHMPGDARPLLYLALTRKRQGETGTALALLSRVLESNPSSAPALSWKVRWNLDDNHLEEAESTLRSAETAGVMTPELRHCALELAVARGRFTEALHRLDALADTLPAEQMQALRDRLSALAVVTPLRSESEKKSS